jgi:hypothetical protein
MFAFKERYPVQTSTILPPVSPFHGLNPAVGSMLGICSLKKKRNGTEKRDNVKMLEVTKLKL